MTTRVTLRLGDADMALLTQACAAANCTPSALLRHLLRQHAGLQDDLADARLPNGQRRATDRRTGRRRRPTL